MLTKELFTRYEGNPILTPEKWPYLSVARVLNPAATIFEGSTLLLVRVKNRIGRSHLTVATSFDGKEGWEVRISPTIQAEIDEAEHESGLEDPRIVYSKESSCYIISCVSFRADFLRNPHGISLISTRDFKSFIRVSKPLSPLNKNASLFPEKINGKFALIHRPSIDGQTCIAVSFSPDLEYWGKLKQILSPVPGTWCNFRVGLATQPIKTKHGWLIIFHGSEDIASKLVYSVGLAMLDLKTLELTHRTEEWVFAPREDYEGGTSGIVFPCGAVVVNGELRMYYGANDYCVALATANMNEVLDYLMKYPVE